MNKKFSTFVASLLLAGAVGTASAAISDKGAMSSYPVAIAKAIDGKFYQLSDGYQVLTMEKTAKGTYVLKFVPYGQAELAKTLWEIKATDSKDEKGCVKSKCWRKPDSGRNGSGGKHLVMDAWGRR